MNIIEDFHIRREAGNQRIHNLNDLNINRFMSLDTKAYESSAVPAKYKELMGLVGSAVLRCNDCIIYHIDASVKCGCTKVEITEALNIALVIGGSIVIPHLRVALEALESYDLE
jgi:AhpD family alkylhydroperoxidase